MSLNKTDEIIPHFAMRKCSIRTQSSTESSTMGQRDAPGSGPKQSKPVRWEFLPHTRWLRMGRVSQGLEDEGGLGSNVYHDLQVEPLDRGPKRDKEAQGAPERVVRTGLMKASAAD